MAGDAKSRYEIVNELANKRINLIDELGELKSKDAQQKADIEKVKLQQARQVEDLKKQIHRALEQNHKMAKQRKDNLVRMQKNHEKELTNLKEQHQEAIDNETSLIALLENDENTKTNHKAQVDQLEKKNAEDIQDRQLELTVNLESNKQAVSDAADKIKSIDLALEAIKHISANNEKTRE